MFATTSQALPSHSSVALRSWVLHLDSQPNASGKHPGKNVPSALDLYRLLVIVP
jgi:hypothetical protein